MLDETNIEQIIYLVIADVKLFQLLEGLDALNVLETGSTKIQNTHILEAGAKIAESADDWVVHFEVFERREDLTRHLQIIEVGVDTKLYLG